MTMCHSWLHEVFRFGALRPCQIWAFVGCPTSKTQRRVPDKKNRLNILRVARQVAEHQNRSVGTRT